MAGLKWTAIATAALPLVAALTPEGMLGAPRRSEVIPNPTGEWGIFSSTNYSWEDHAATSVWNLLNLTSGEYDYLADGSEVAEIAWLGGNSSTALVYLNGTNEEEDGGVSLYAADATDISGAALIGSFPAPYAGWKHVLTPSGDVHFLVYCLAFENGTAYNPDPEYEPLNTARVYESTWVRHWDTWLDDTRNNLFKGVLTADGDSFSFDGNLTNLQVGIKNISRAETPDRPFGDSTNYALSPDGETVAWWTRNIDIPLANKTSAYIWLQPFDIGYSANPTFSHDGTKIAYFQMDSDYYEADRNKIYIANADVANPNITQIANDWDRSPSGIAWANDDLSVFVQADDLGHSRIFEIPADAPADFQPTNITGSGVVAAFSILASDDILVADSKVWSSRDYYVISPEGEVITELLKANEEDEALAGLSEADFREFYFPTPNNSALQELHSIMVLPAGFDESETYPLAYIIHGGPQGYNGNSWSTRWNFKLWADQGYVVVAPNPTASTGFGQALTDLVQGNWGGTPYEDIVACYEYIGANFPFIDLENGIEAGASYGGYMTNWIQGHDLGRKFKALVTHDGSTDTRAQYSSEEMFFIEHDNNGSFLDVPENYDRWSPVNFYENWATPHLVIHNSLDYRLGETEGLHLFNLLQEKGVPSKFLNFPDENHWVLNRENSLAWHSEVFGWVNYWSGLSEVSPFHGSTSVTPRFDRGGGGPARRRRWH
ncbi:putative dipeptidyl-peptidase 5 [Cyphellophora attinorum]|uniref:Dipeptidyl-peptidase V n=1 Tax=Cyphellophora attinorum TaxID=1664694 RepID=A0A0N0NIV6_9EURO|nr:putative dipeptidyl-peptidase 5 [Phialophora attinorum]KPI36271.1 putative dipeptidyl-peptidase 5 [Phialophora attinorum]